MLRASAKPGSSGFTLIEIAVTLAVLGVVLALGLSSIFELIRNSEVRTAAESILNGMQTARTEAVRRNTLVAFTLTDPGSAGNTGWSIDVAGSGANIQAKAATEGGKRATVTPSPAGATAVTFNSYGRTRIENMNLDGSAFLTQVDLAATDATRPLRIVILPGGEIRMCDPNVSATGDPRKC